MKRRIRITILVCLALCLGLFGAGSIALSEEQSAETVERTEQNVQLRISNERAEQEYINGLFGLPVTPEDELPRMRGTAGGETLVKDSPERNLYATLKTRVQQIAAGELSSAEFVISTGEFDMAEYTFDFLGVDNFDDAFDKAGERIDAFETTLSTI